MRKPVNSRAIPVTNALRIVTDSGPVASGPDSSADLIDGIIDAATIETESGQPAQETEGVSQGRPPANSPSTVGNIGAASEASGDGSFDPKAYESPRRRKRGPNKTTLKPASPQVPINENILEKMIFNCHQMLAAMTSVSELALTEDEARELSAATCELARHYDVTASAKTIAWSNFAFAVGTIEGTRILAIYNKIKAQNKQKGMTQ